MVCVNNLALLINLASARDLAKKTQEEEKDNSADKEREKKKRYKL